MYTLIVEIAKWFALPMKQFCDEGYLDIEVGVIIRPPVNLQEDLFQSEGVF